MLKAEFKPRAAEFGLAKANLDCAKQTSAEIADDMTRLDEALSVRESATIRRIHAALSLLESDALAEVVPDGGVWREEIRALYPVARHVGKTVLPALAAEHEAHQALLAVLSKWTGNEQNSKFHNAIRRATKALSERLEELKWKLGDSLAYPFDHAGGIVSLGQYALPRVPSADDIDGTLEVAGSVVAKLIPLHMRMVGRLMLAAEEVEKVLGLDPLPERPKAAGEEAAP